MGRRRAFDEDTVLEDVMTTFWAHGFDATSIQDLVDATGLERGSLYNAFGDKDRLFQLAFERYDEPRRLRMRGRSNPVPTLRSFFDHLARSACADADQKGCLLINSTQELGHLSPQSSAKVMTALDDVEQFFTTMIAMAQDDGALDRSVDPVRASHVMLGAVTAIRLLSRVRSDPQTFTDLAENALAAAGIDGRSLQ